MMGIPITHFSKFIHKFNYKKIEALNFGNECLRKNITYIRRLLTDPSITITSIKKERLHSVSAILKECFPQKVKTRLYSHVDSDTFDTDLDTNNVDLDTKLRHSDISLDTDLDTKLEHSHADSDN